MIGNRCQSRSGCPMSTSTNVAAMVTAAMASNSPKTTTSRAGFHL